MLIHLARALFLLSHHGTPGIPWRPNRTYCIDSDINWKLLNGRDFSESPSLYLVYRHILPNENGVLGWGTHVNSWLIHVNVWQKPLQYCKVISLHLIKINGKKMSFSGLSDYTTTNNHLSPFTSFIPVVNASLQFGKFLTLRGAVLPTF